VGKNWKGVFADAEITSARKAWESRCKIQIDPTTGIMFGKQIASLSEFERLDRSSRITPCWKKAIILYKKHSAFRIFIFFLPLMIVFFATVTDYWRWGCIFLKQIQILSRFQLTRHSIDFVFVETKQFVGSNTNVILMRQTWGHRSSMSAWSKRRALAFHLSIFFCYTFLISKCRGELDLGLCTTPILAKRSHWMATSD